MPKTKTTPPPCLREKFRIKPLELWELFPYRSGGIACFRGTWKLFGLLSAVTQASPLLNFINQAMREFPYRHYSLVVDERSFKFKDGKGCSYSAQVIDGGKP